MEICSFSHEAIVYKEGNCPLCSARIGHDMVVKALEDDIQVLEDTVEGFKKIIAERVELDSEVNRLCQLIVNSPSNTTIKGDIESLALLLGHHPNIIGAGRSER